MKYLNDISYKDCVGKVCKSLNSGDFKIVKYNDNRNVEIQFFKTGFEMVAQLTTIRSGLIKDPYLPSVHGVGITGTKYPVSEGGRDIKEYKLWHSMLKRCYSDGFKRNTQLMKVVEFQITSYTTSIFTNGVMNKLVLVWMALS